MSEAVPMTPQQVSPVVEGAMEDPEALIHVHEPWCKSCDLCVKFCPRHCLELNEKRIPVLTDPDLCTLCGMCEYLCPDFAITVLQLRWQKG